jgi:hypothetical protein
MPINFANGKIYCIRSHQTEQIYIGSTTQPLYKRFHRHKQMDSSSKEILKYSDAFIELLEEFPCANKMQLNRREGELIRTTDCVNKRIAGRTLVEYKVDNKDYLFARDKQYREDNKQKITEKYNCFCGGKYINSHKQEHFKSKKHLEFIRQLSA